MSKIKRIEDQQTEFKESWRDDFLKYVCGFANAQGGIMVHIPIHNQELTPQLTPQLISLYPDIHNHPKQQYFLSEDGLSILNTIALDNNHPHSAN